MHKVDPAGATAFMTTQITDYTHLESLLLFQALRADGVDSISFTRISDQLQSVPLIRSDPTYDSGRLSPDALRELYCGLLKEEAKHDLERQQLGDNPLTNGDVSPGSRKRKAPSPSVPTVSEAAQHSHLIPQLVERLYARYRENAILKIKGLEHKYVECKRQIDEIEGGQWDEGLQREDGLKRQRPASQTNSPRPSPKPSSTAHTQPIPHRQDRVQPASASASPLVSKSQPESNAQAPPKRYSQAKIESVINHGPEPQDGPGHRKTSSITKLPSLQEMAPHSPHFGISPKIPGPAPHQQQPMQPMPTQAPNHAYSPAGHHSPYAPQHAHPRQGSLNSPQLQQSLSRPSSSPRPILPPPSGMPMPPQSPGSHTGSPGPHYGPPHQPQQQHYQAPPPAHLVPSGPQLGGYPTTPLPHHNPAYYPQQAYQERRTPYQQQHPQTPTYSSQPPPPHPNQQQHMSPHPAQMQQGMYMQPFQVTPQDPTKAIHQQHIRPQPPPVQPQPPQRYASHAPTAPSTGPRPPPQQRMVSDIIAALATPPRPRIRPLWKEKYRPSPTVTGTEQPRPAAEPLSPTHQRAKSPAQSTRSTRGRDVPAAENTLQVEPASKTRSSRRRGNARDKSPHSVVSSTADESLRARSTRSQSVSTAAGAYLPSDDRPASRNGVKMEPSTPANMLDDAEPMPAPSATPVTGMVTRKRRGTLQSQPLPPSKRKRQESPTGTNDDEHFPTPPPRGNTVMATRNFVKMSSAVMNDIMSHKHAAYFANPVRDKDAPGYSDIVLQPQNLKAIRAAMTAGTQAVKTATTAMDSPSDTSSGASATVELDRTAEVIPPKAIVNGAQLEKELYRMFANAYMFNPGEDGMAQSTKEMFEDVEATMSEWRGTERLAGGDEDEEGKGKRRKG